MGNITSIRSDGPDEIGIKLKYLYFIQTECAEYLKIGVSHNPMKRLLQLQHASPMRLYLRCWSPMSPHWSEFEAKAKILFRQYRIHGEWYRLTTEVAAFLDIFSFASGFEHDRAVDEEWLPEYREYMRKRQQVREEARK